MTLEQHHYAAMLTPTSWQIFSPEISGLAEKSRREKAQQKKKKIKIRIRFIRRVKSQPGPFGRMKIEATRAAFAAESNGQYTRRMQPSYVAVKSSNGISTSRTLWLKRILVTWIRLPAPEKLATWKAAAVPIEMDR